MKRMGGTVIFNGETIEKTTPIQALRRGLSIIYQEFNLVNKMTVGENIFLGRFGETKGMKGTHQRARALLDSIGSTIDTHTIVGEPECIGRCRWSRSPRLGPLTPS